MTKLHDQHRADRPFVPVGDLAEVIDRIRAMGKNEAMVARLIEGIVTEPLDDVAISAPVRTMRERGDLPSH